MQAQARRDEKPRTEQRVQQCWLSAITEPSREFLRRYHPSMTVTTMIMDGAQRLIETAQDSLISITEQTRDRDYEEARRNYSVIESSSRNDPIRVRARIRRRWEIAAKGELAPSLSAPATYSAGNRQLFSVFVMRYSGVNNAIVPRAICS